MADHHMNSFQMLLKTQLNNYGQKQFSANRISILITGILYSIIHVIIFTEIIIKTIIVIAVKCYT